MAIVMVHVVLYIFIKKKKSYTGYALEQNRRNLLVPWDNAVFATSLKYYHTLNSQQKKSRQK